MQILVPISTYFDTSSHFQPNLTPLSQLIASGKQLVRLNDGNVNRLRLRPDKKGRAKPVRLQSVPLGEVLTGLEALPTTEEVLLLVPSPNFDATPYNNMIQSILYRYPALQTCTLDCYGSALSYMVEGLVSFCNQGNPSAAQLALFVNKLSEQIQTYAICPHSPIFDPSVHPIFGWVASLLRLNRVYRSDMPTWQPTKVEAIARRLQKSSLTESNIWIDSHDGSSHVRWVTKKFEKWGIQKEQLIFKTLQHTSTSFPRRFALITIVPNKQKVKQLATWALRWEE